MGMGAIQLLQREFVPHLCTEPVLSLRGPVAVSEERHVYVQHGFCGVRAELNEPRREQGRIPTMDIAPHPAPKTADFTGNQEGHLQERGRLQRGGLSSARQPER